MKALEWLYNFSVYKSMGFFQDAQGQLTPQSLIQSYEISKPYKILWMSSLSARMMTSNQKWRHQSGHNTP